MPLLVSSGVIVAIVIVAVIIVILVALAVRRGSAQLDQRRRAAAAHRSDAATISRSADGLSLRQTNRLSVPSGNALRPKNRPSAPSANAPRPSITRRRLGRSTPMRTSSAIPSPYPFSTALEGPFVLIEAMADRLTFTRGRHPVDLNMAAEPLRIEHDCEPVVMSTDPPGAIPRVPPFGVVVLWRSA